MPFLASPSLSRISVTLFFLPAELFITYLKLLWFRISPHDILESLRMPKKSQKSNQREVADDFDDMLADFRADDLANAPPSHVAPIIADAVPSNGARAQTFERCEVSGATILAAMEAGDLSRLRWWHRQGLEFTPDVVCGAAELGSMAVMKCLVEELGALKKAGFDGTTPVVVAAWNGHVSFVRYLGKLGADVNKADTAGLSPLFIAALNGHLDVVQCLLKEFGADVNQPAVEGITPLMAVAGDGNLAMVQCLGKEHGADVNIADQSDATAVMIAARNGHLDVVQCLVAELRADVNHRDENGCTALMMASLGKHDKIIRWLTRHGADAQASAFGDTAVDASTAAGAPIAQTEYLQAKAHCSNPGCSGAGLKKCTGCKQARYCGQTCQLAHWKAHKGDCKASK
jgi:hypothetical protein